MPRISIEEILEKSNKDICHQQIGIEATHIDKKECRMILHLKEWHVNLEGYVHGGVLFSALDTAMGMCVYPYLEDDEWILAIDIKINFLKGATLEMKGLPVHAVLVSRTRRLAVSEGEIRSPDGEILCKSLGTFAILKERS